MSRRLNKTVLSSVCCEAVCMCRLMHAQGQWQIIPDTRCMRTAETATSPELKRHSYCLEHLNEKSQKYEEVWTDSCFVT